MHTFLNSTMLLASLSECARRLSSIWEAIPHIKIDVEKEL